MALVKCNDLSLGYEGRTVVKNITFSVDKGDYLCIVGENGSGKSTLMKTVLGLHKPMSGEIKTGDDLKPWEIGYLPQQTEIQKDFPASVREIVLSGCLGGMGMRPFYGKKERQKAQSTMERLGISHLARECYRKLSGGQQQKVLLARALCATSKLVFLDEPVAGLDPHSQAEMYSIIQRLNKEDKVTVIMITHDLKASAKYASHILHISHEPLFFGTKEDYLESDVGKRYMESTKEGQI